MKVATDHAPAGSARAWPLGRCHAHDATTTRRVNGLGAHLLRSVLDYQIGPAGRSSPPNSGQGPRDRGSDIHQPSPDDDGEPGGCTEMNASISARGRRELHWPSWRAPPPGGALAAQDPPAGRHPLGPSVRDPADSVPYLPCFNPHRFASVTSTTPHGRDRASRRGPSPPCSPRCFQPAAPYSRKELAIPSSPSSKLITRASSHTAVKITAPRGRAIPPPSPDRCAPAGNHALVSVARS